MSMSTFIEAIKPKDEKFEKMELIYNSCKELDVPIPDDVIFYFNDKKPSVYGVVIGHYDLPPDCFSKYEDLDGLKNGYTIYLDKLPEDVKVIRVYNQW